jgi:excisionase family DNA binding protein
VEALLLRVPEVAVRLGLSRAKVYQLMANGDLPSVKVGGCRRVRSEDLRAFTKDLRATWAAAGSDFARGRTKGPN